MPKYEVNVTAHMIIYEEIYLTVEAADEEAAGQKALQLVEDNGGSLEWEEYDAGDREGYEIYATRAIKPEPPAPATGHDAVSLADRLREVGRIPADYPPSEFALAEGWCIMHSDERGWMIQRDDSPDVEASNRFETDEDALAHVQACAKAGSVYHLKCLAFVGKSWTVD